MSTTSSVPSPQPSAAPPEPPPPSSTDLIVTFAQIGLGVLSGFVSGGIALDVQIASQVAPLVGRAVNLISKPALSGITSLLDDSAKLLESVSTGTTQAAAKVADALVQMVQAGAAAVQQQSGLPIDPSTVPPLPPFNPPAAS